MPATCRRSSPWHPVFLDWTVAAGRSPHLYGVLARHWRRGRGAPGGEVMTHDVLICEGHIPEGVAAQVVMRLAWAFAGRWPSEYRVCLDCAEAFQDAVDEWEPYRIAGLRGYQWERLPLSDHE